MRMETTTRNAVELTMMKMGAMKPTTNAAMVQENRHPMAQLLTQTMRTIRMRRFSSKTTVRPEGALMIKWVRRYLVIMSQKGMPMG